MIGITFLTRSIFQTYLYYQYAAYLIDFLSSFVWLLTFYFFSTSILLFSSNTFFTGLLILTMSIAVLSFLMKSSKFYWLELWMKMCVSERFLIGYDNLKSVWLVCMMVYPSQISIVNLPSVMNLFRICRILVISYSSNLALVSVEYTSSFAEARVILKYLDLVLRLRRIEFFSKVHSHLMVNSEGALYLDIQINLFCHLQFISNYQLNQQMSTRKKGQKHQNKTAWTVKFDTKFQEEKRKVKLNGLCKRCMDQILWKLQFGKYRKATQPSKCNICSEKVVVKTYHNACDPCAKQKDICSKCLKSNKEVPQPEQIPELDDKKRKVEQTQEQKNMNRFLKKLRERSKRTVMRMYSKQTALWDNTNLLFTDLNGQPLQGLKFREEGKQQDFEDIDEDDMDEDFDDDSF